MIRKYSFLIIQITNNHREWLDSFFSFLPVSFFRLEEIFAIDSGHR